MDAGDALDGGSNQADAGEDAGADAGQSPGPAIRCDPPVALDFGSVAVGITSMLRVFCINDGQSVPGHPEDNLFIPSEGDGGPGLSIVGGGTAFEAAFDRPFPTDGLVAGGDGTNIDVDYFPSGQGTDTGELLIESNDPRNPTTRISMTGTGIYPPSCGFTVGPSRFDLGTVHVDETQNLTISITNVGNADCLLSFDGFGGLGPKTSPEFSLPLVPGGNIFIGAGKSYDIAVNFLPTNIGPYQGQIDWLGGLMPVTATVE